MSLTFDEKEEKALGMTNLTQFYIAWVVWPVAFASLITLGHRCYKEKRLIDALPLLATQLNSTLVWVCIGAYEVGYYNHNINGSTFLKVNYGTLYSEITRTFLNSMISFEPLNLFLYTWRFLDQLEYEETNKFMKQGYKWFARVSIVILPLSFFYIVPTFIVEISKSIYYEALLERAEYKHYNAIAMKYQKALASIQLISNFLACIILVLVVRLLTRMTKSIEVGKDKIDRKNKINSLVTATHILVTLAYSITLTIPIFEKQGIQTHRMQTAQYFFGGVADLFLSVMVWFILDNSKAPTVFVDGDRVYAVTNVIKAGQSDAINNDCEEDQIEEEDHGIVGRNAAPSFSGVSKRMIEQFFHEVEGPDRDWSEDGSEYFEEGERDSLMLED